MEKSTRLIWVSSLPSPSIQAHMGSPQRRSLQRDAPPAETQVSSKANGVNPQQIHPQNGWKEWTKAAGYKGKEEERGGGDRWRMCSGDICRSLRLIPYFSPLLRLCTRPFQLSAAGGERTDNSYLGRRKREKKREEEKWGKRANAANGSSCEEFVGSAAPCVPRIWRR